MLFTCARFPILFRLPWLLRSAALRFVMLLTPWRPPRLLRLDTLEKCGQDDRDGTPSKVTECCFCPMEGDAAAAVPAAQRRLPDWPDAWRPPPWAWAAAAAAPFPAACLTKSWSRANSSIRTAWLSVLIILPNDAMEDDPPGPMGAREPMEFERGKLCCCSDGAGCCGCSCWYCCCW